MMQPCASAAKLRGGGPILPLGMTAMSHLGTPPPRNRHRRPRHKRTDWAENCRVAFSDLRSLRRAQNDAVRHHAPPATSRHRAIRSLRAKATIMVLRVPRGGSRWRARKPLRQGALLLEHEKSPRQLDHASPNSSVAGTGQPLFSRRFVPLSSGEPVRPRITRYGPVGSRMFSRQHLLHQHVGRLDANPDHPAPAGRTMACGPSPGRLLDAFQASILDLADLITDQPTALHVATQLSQTCWTVLALPQGVRKSSRRPAAFFSLGLKPRMPSRN